MCKQRLRQSDGAFTKAIAGWSECMAEFGYKVADDADEQQLLISQLDGVPSVSGPDDVGPEDPNVNPAEVLSELVAFEVELYQHDQNRGERRAWQQRKQRLTRPSSDR
jgi:hypothetical protein